MHSSTSQKFASQQPGDSFEWGDACGRAAFPSFTACSKYLDSSRNSYTRNQAAEYRHIVTFFNGLAVMSFGGGDFNLYPTDSELNGWYSAYDEADGCGSDCGRATRDDGDKVDYIFVPEGSMCVLHSAYIDDWDDPSSDHQLVQGLRRRLLMPDVVVRAVRGGPLVGGRRVHRQWHRCSRTPGWSHHWRRSGPGDVP